METRTLSIQNLTNIDLGSFALKSVLAIAFAVSALVGRFATFVSSAPTTFAQLVGLLAISFAAIGFATYAKSSTTNGCAETKLVNVAQRIGGVQVVIGLGLMTLAAV